MNSVGKLLYALVARSIGIGLGLFQRAFYECPSIRGKLELHHLDSLFLDTKHELQHHADISLANHRDIGTGALPVDGGQSAYP